MLNPWYDLIDRTETVHFQKEAWVKATAWVRVDRESRVGFSISLYHPSWPLVGLRTTLRSSGVAEPPDGEGTWLVCWHVVQPRASWPTRWDWRFPGASWWSRLTLRRKPLEDGGFPFLQRSSGEDRRPSTAPCKPADEARTGSGTWNWAEGSGTPDHAPAAPSSLFKQLSSISATWHQRHSEWYKDREANIKGTQFLLRKAHFVLLGNITTLEKSTLRVLSMPLWFLWISITYICLGLFFFSLWNEDSNCVVCVFLSFKLEF